MAKDNEQVQKLGIVDIVNMLDNYQSLVDYEFIRKGTQIFLCSPTRFAFVYFLVDGKSPWNKVLDFMNFIVGRMVQVRSRALRGTFVCSFHMVMYSGVSLFRLSCVLKPMSSFVSIHSHILLCRLRISSRMQI